MLQIKAQFAIDRKSIIRLYVSEINVEEFSQIGEI